MNINLVSTSVTSTFLVLSFMYTLKTGTPIKDGDPILKLLRGVSCPAIHYCKTLAKRVLKGTVFKNSTQRVLFKYRFFLSAVFPRHSSLAV